MKLKFICAPASGNGGTETVLVKALNYLTKEYQVELYLTTIPENRLWLRQMSRSIQIHEPKNSKKITKYLYLLNIFLQADNQDTFIILGANTIKVAAKVRKLFNKKYKIISWIHYSLINQNMFNPQNIKLADYHWAISTPIQNQLIDLGIPEEKISLIFNPIEPFKGKLNVADTSDTLKLVYVGKVMLDGQKNLRELFNGIKNYPGKIHVDLFGADTSNGKVNEYIKQLGIADKITIHGWLKDPWTVILNDIHPNALVLTSKYEGLPMVMLEAMARGIPCFVANFSGYEDIIKNENGIVYQQGNVQDLVSQLIVLTNIKFISNSVQNSISLFYGDSYYNRLNNTVKMVN